MKRNLFLIIGIFLAIIFLIVVGNIITIGEKLADITGYKPVEYLWYGAIGLLCAGYIVWPCIKIYHAPSLPSLTLDDKKDLKAVRRFARQLAANCRYIAEADVRERHAADLQKAIKEAKEDKDALTALIQKEIALRIEGNEELNVISIDKRIREWAKSVFMITAIAHNSKFDALTMLFLNHKMIEGVILSSGFRPTNAQMFRIYTWIIGTAFFSYLISDPLDSIGDVRPFAGLEDGELDTSGDIDWGDAIASIKVPGIVISSIADGAANTLMSLRIGYIAKAYITNGAEKLQGRENRKAIKREALKKAASLLPGIGAEVTKELTAKAATKTWEQVKGTTEKVAQSTAQKVRNLFR